MHWDRDKSLEVLQNEFFHGTGQYQALRLMLEAEAIAVCERVFRAVGSPYWFTDHGPDHSDCVFSNALRIARHCGEFVGRLNAAEAQTLAYCCYLHDLAMASVPSWFGSLDTLRTGEVIAEVRLRHTEAISEVLNDCREHLQQFTEWQPLYAGQLPQICAAHGTDSHRTICEELSKEGGSEFRGDLLAQILLLADELDLAHHRCVMDHPQFEHFPVSAKAHHFRHYYVVDVELHLPRIRIKFAFPRELGREGRNAFITWTCGKVRDMLTLIRENLPANYRDAFDFDLQPQEVEVGADRSLCPEEVLRFVIHQSRKYQIPEQLRSRPNQFHPERENPFRHGPFYPHLDNLMDEFFREGTTGSLRQIFDEAYVWIDDNERCAGELLRQWRGFCMRLREGKHGPHHEPFVLTGVAGVGKSALVEQLRLKGELKTKLDPMIDRRIVVYVDCRPMLGFDQVARGMLGGLVQECGRSKSITSKLKELGFDLRSGVLAAFAEDVACDMLTSILAALHGDTTTGALARTYPVCFILDNLDLARGMEIKEQAYRFARAQQGNSGYPFFIIPLRPANKHLIETRRNESDFAAIPENRVRCPLLGEVIARRLEAAFGKGRDTFWKTRPDFEVVLASKTFKPEDLRCSLESAMKTLCNGRVAFIPFLAGSNTRNALTLFRTIMKYAELPELYSLAKGEAREHYLIRCAALEGHPLYFAEMSNLRNLFDPMPTGSYFAKLYALRVLATLQSRGGSEDYVEFGDWADRARQLGMSNTVLRQEVWSMLAGEFALVQALSHDDSQPSGMLRSHDSLASSTEVRLSPAGRYYLDWLIFDFAYLQCVLQDTSMPEEIARELVAPWHPVSEALEAVDGFIQFLERMEHAERSAWIPLPETPAVVPEMRNRFERQRRSLSGSNP